MARPRTESRDTAKQGLSLNHFLIEFSIAKDRDEANRLIREGRIEIDNLRVKDILYFVAPGTHYLRVRGEHVLTGTLI
jgi:hypothetical protein